EAFHRPALFPSKDPLPLCLQATAEVRGDIQEVHPTVQVIAIAERNIVDCEHLVPIHERRGLIEHVAYTRAEGPDVAIEIHRHRVEEVVVGKTVSPAIDVACSQTKTGIGCTFDSIAEDIDSGSILLDT